MIFKKIKTCLASIGIRTNFSQQTYSEGILHQSLGKFGVICITQEDSDLRVLRFGHSGPRQSVIKVGHPDHLILPYTRSAMVGLTFMYQPLRILILGLGGGAIPMFLRNHFPDIEIDVVEIDPELIELAKKYLGFCEDDKLKVHASDGRKFVLNSKHIYDIIFLDCYSSDGIPYHLTTNEFLLCTKKVLNPSGVVIANLWSGSLNPIYDSMLRTYQSVFHDTYILNILGSSNKIMIASPAYKNMTPQKILERIHSHAVYRGLPFQLHDLLGPGFRSLDESGFGEILYDKD
jgi:spermidine synthase